MLTRHVPRLHRGVAATLAVTALGCAFSAQASAETTINVTKGVASADRKTTFVGSFDDTAPTRTSVIRAGAVVDHTTLAFELVIGDVITAAHFTTGAVLAQATFDGLPSLDANTCFGSAALSGTRTVGATVNSVFAYKRVRVTTPGRYGGSFDDQQEIIRGSVLTASGANFAGTFRRAIPSGHILSASETVPLTDTATYFASVERDSAACPPPAPPAPPAAPVRDTTKPSGKLILPKFLRKSLLRNTRRGVNVRADINEAGSVKVDVFRATGRKVRYATGKKSTTRAARITVKLKATTLGRRAMRGRRSIKATVVATLTDKAGNVRRLRAKKITIR